MTRELCNKDTTIKLGLEKQKQIILMSVIILTPSFPLKNTSFLLNVIPAFQLLFFIFNRFISSLLFPQQYTEPCQYISLSYGCSLPGSTKEMLLICYFSCLPFCITCPVNFVEPYLTFFFAIHCLPAVGALLWISLQNLVCSATLIKTSSTSS